MTDDDYEKLSFAAMLREIFPTTTDNTYYYILGALDAATALSDKLGEVDHGK